MTKQLIYTTEIEAINELKLIEAHVKVLHDSGTTTYSYIVKHPAKDLWAIRIGLNDKYFKKVSEIIDNRKLTTITTDWFNNGLI